MITNTKEIADYFGKQHRHVISLVRARQKEGIYQANQTRDSFYQGNKTGMMPMVELDLIAALELVGSFSGGATLKFKKMKFTQILMERTND
ncbi:Rha family transcriptional regulator [Vibrio agarivorans]|uniref:Rha family transcriptional regulator n=1 Tax=Vibrio agarivorans TaxID=153622 RepID=UPI0025B59311|nr:Rha family transcriptional regulator [Vibrio agarivorans]MDN3659943.1 hypothetical protein [Vibrio agarivorans]